MEPQHSEQTELINIAIAYRQYFGDKKVADAVEEGHIDEITGIRIVTGMELLNEIKTGLREP
jgi:hypothetical protein